MEERPSSEEMQHPLQADFDWLTKAAEVCDTEYCPSLNPGREMIHWKISIRRALYAETRMARLETALRSIVNAWEEDTKADSEGYHAWDLLIDSARTALAN